MDVESVFLNGFLNEEVYVSQPPGFEDHLYPNHMFSNWKRPYMVETSTFGLWCKAKQGTFVL